jgi:hypothetical protein
MTDIIKEEEITLLAPGSLPGIPGTHAPGTYLVDYTARTIREKPVQDAPAPVQEIAPPVEEPAPTTGVEAPQSEPAQVSAEQLAAQVAEIEQQLKAFEPGTQ